MEYSPPPLFKQGPSAFAQLVFFLFLSLGLLLIDSRLQSLGTVRRGIEIALYPLEKLMLMPRDTANAVSDYFSSATRLSRENDALRKNSVALNLSAQKSNTLSTENTQLRKLLGLKEIMPAQSMAAEINYEARDPYTHRVVINRGSKDSLAAGLPVIDSQGLLGQVTRVFLLQSEVTLITDSEQAIPVQVVRSGVRGIAYGSSRPGFLDLRYMATSADLQPGDILTTSGLDGTYPPGLPVATITQIERKVDAPFAKIYCKPVAGVNENKHVLILQYKADIPPRPAELLDSSKAGRSAESKKNKASAKSNTKPADASAVSSAASAPKSVQP